MWNFPLFPERASTGASEVDAVFAGAMLVVVFFTTLILVLIMTFLIRYRRGRKTDRSNPPLTNIKLEVAWIGIPLLISIAMFTVATLVYFRLYEAPPDAYEVSVVGKRWMFTLQHPEGKREINELHVP